MNENRKHMAVDRDTEAANLFLRIFTEGENLEVVEVIGRKE